jgi:hypothetical protein
MREVQESYTCPITQSQLKPILVTQVADVKTWLKPYIQLSKYNISYPHCFKLWRNESSMKDDVMISARFMAWKPAHKHVQWITKQFYDDKVMKERLRQFGQRGSIGEPMREVPLDFNEQGFRDSLKKGKQMGYVQEHHVKEWNDLFTLMLKLRAGECERCVQLFDAYKRAPRGKVKENETEAQSVARRQLNRERQALQDQFEAHRAREHQHTSNVYTAMIDGSADGLQPFWSNYCFIGHDEFASSSSSSSSYKKRCDALPTQNELSYVNDLFPHACDDPDVNDCGRRNEIANAILSTQAKQKMEHLTKYTKVLVNYTPTYRYPFGIIANILEEFKGAKSTSSDAHVCVCM